MIAINQHLPKKKKICIAKIMEVSSPINAVMKTITVIITTDNKRPITPKEK